MATEVSWEEFLSSGLLWFVNMILNAFGYAIAIDMVNGKVVHACPARVKYRGCEGEYNDMGYCNMSKYMAENAITLLHEAEDSYCDNIARNEDTGFLKSKAHEDIQKLVDEYAERHFGKRRF